MGMRKRTTDPDGIFNLTEIFEQLNQRHFDGFLDLPELKWNSRIRTSAGRFIPGHRWVHFINPPVIEVASYLKEEPNAEELIRDTIAHEMIHYWLWVRKRPYGHTQEFYAKLREVGASRYNPVPRSRPYKWVYRCKSCRKEFFARRKLRPYACADCCRKHADGQYDARFKLSLDRAYDAAADSPRSPGEPLKSLD